MLTGGPIDAVLLSDDAGELELGERGR